MNRFSQAATDSSFVVSFAAAHSRFGTRPVPHLRHAEDLAWDKFSCEFFGQFLSSNFVPFGDLQFLSAVPFDYAVYISCESVVRVGVSRIGVKRLVLSTLTSRHFLLGGLR